MRSHLWYRKMNFTLFLLPDTITVQEWAERDTCAHTGAHTHTERRRQREEEGKGERGNMKAREKKARNRKEGREMEGET